MNKSNIKLLLSYDGTDYCGWQRQQEHACSSKKPSLQGTLEQALEKLFNHPVTLLASGRTDAGVHARGQVCNFETSRPIPKDICWALTRYLPSSISVKKAWHVPPEFHSTLSATHKTYKYWVWNSLRTSALLDRYSTWVRKPLDLVQLQAIGNVIVGEHDFKSFQSSGTPVPHTVRRILKVSWSQHGKNPNLIEFSVTGTGFLKQMVRNLVGTQLDLFVRGKGPEDMKNILEAKDRTKAGPSAEARGLFLFKVYYPSNLDKDSRPL